MAARKPAAATAPAAHASLNEALLAIQAGMPAFQRDSVNPHFGSAYLSLESLLPTVTEILNANGVLLQQLPTSILAEGNVVPALQTRLTHVATGEFVESSCPLSAGKDTPQAQGSALTYLRRYMLTSALTITAEKDDDGARGSIQAQVSQTPAAATVPVADGGFGQSF